MRANKKASGKKDMETILFGHILYPTYKNIKEARKFGLDLKRQIAKQINTSTFTQKQKKTTKRRGKISKQIQRGYDTTKKWKDEYDEKKKSLL